MTTTIDTNQWCGQFKRCNGCKLQSECMVKPEEMFPVMEDGKYVDKWAIRTTAMIARELGKLKWFTEFGHLNRGDMLTSEQHRCHNEKKKFQRRV